MRLLDILFREICNSRKFGVIKLIFSFSFFNAFNAKEFGWLRVCDSDYEASNHYEVDATTCPHGSWLSMPISTGCVCLNGLWAIGRGWCDQDYKLFLGKGHCFKIHGEFQKLAFLGDPENPFAPSNFMTKRNGHTFKSFKKEIATPYEYEKDFYEENLNKTILRMNPKKSEKILMEMTPSIVGLNFDTTSPPVCINPVDTSPSEETTLYVYKVREAIKTLQVTEACPTNVNTHLSSNYKEMSVMKIRPGESIHVKSGTISKASTICSATCSFQPHTKENVIRHKRDASTTDSDKNTYMGLSLKDNQRLINEETLRIIKAELRFLLEKEKLPILNTTNWKIMQKAKNVLTKACPELHAPSFLINAMLRHFRMIYIHTRDFNPFGQFFEETDQIVRIATNLDQCFNDAAPFDFQYLSDKVNSTCYEKITNKTDDKNATTEVKEEFCKCTDKLNIVSLNYTRNASNPNEMLNLTGNEILLPKDYTFMLMPASEKFNGSNRDLPIETTWKIVNFAHYYCAKYFKHNPTDHSAMLMKMESFFNSEVVYRWNHPGLRTNETWQALYSSFNMQKFADSIDSCIASAKQVSEYPEWIVRPTMESLQRKKRSLDFQTIPSGTAFCLQEPWDPVNKLGVKVKDECYEWNNL